MSPSIVLGEVKSLQSAKAHFLQGVLLNDCNTVKTA